jgi:hypothetical protein
MKITNLILDRDISTMEFTEEVINYLKSFNGLADKKLEKLSSYIVEERETILAEFLELKKEKDILQEKLNLVEIKLASKLKVAEGMINITHDLLLKKFK